MSIEKTPSKNEVLFTWFNHYSGITIKTPTKSLAVDPVDVKPKTFQNIDAILITHEHYDHLDQSLVSEIHKLNQCTVIADATSAKRLRNDITPEKLSVVQPGSEIKVGEISVKAEKSNHAPASTPVSLIITSEDGVRLFHTSDSLPYPEMEAIGQREKLDVVFCTVAVAPGASPETGVEIARLTKPKVAVPYHAGTRDDQVKFAELLKKEMPRITCLVPEIGKIYQISKRGT
jgi:L-ascorbate metabolism protein UlaG (beta-lactamase superfamily)